MEADDLLWLKEEEEDSINKKMAARFLKVLDVFGQKT